MLVEFVRRKVVPRTPAANDGPLRSDRIAKVALALRDVFPNITSVQAEQAALDLTACRRPRSQLRCRTSTITVSVTVPFGHFTS